MLPYLCYMFRQVGLSKQFDQEQFVQGLHCLSFYQWTMVTNALYISHCLLFHIHSLTNNKYHLNCQFCNDLFFISDASEIS